MKFQTRLDFRLSVETFAAVGLMMVSISFCWNFKCRSWILNSLKRKWWMGGHIGPGKTFCQWQTFTSRNSNLNYHIEYPVMSMKYVPMLSIGCVIDILCGVFDIPNCHEDKPWSPSIRIWCIISNNSRKCSESKQKREWGCWLYITLECVIYNGILTLGILLNNSCRQNKILSLQN